MTFNFLPFVGGMLRIAASLRGCQRELKRIADTMELQNSRGGVALRTNYSDTRDGAVDEASLLMQDDAEFAQLERLERERAKKGVVSLDDDLEDPRG